MCQGEWEVIRVRIAPDLSCTGSGKWKDAKIDRCISSLVRALQEGGIDMRDSCCGHGKKDGHILLEDGRILIIKESADEYLAELERGEK